MDYSDRQQLMVVKGCFSNAQLQLVYAIRALERIDSNFEETTKQIKQTIGDLQVAITELHEVIK